MRCTNWVATKQTKTRSVVTFLCIGNKDRQFATEVLEEFRGHTKYPLVDFGRCGGSIKVMIAAVNEPVFGGTEARLEVFFVCEKCRTEVVDDHLPNEYNISKWLTEVMKTWEPE